MGLQGHFKINTSLEDLKYHLRNKGPVGISIKYGRGQLSKSPLVKTSGHLITLIRLDEKEALVLDSAQKTRKEVLTVYTTKELLEAWVRHQRFCYFFNL